MYILMSNVSDKYQEAVTKLTSVCKKKQIFWTNYREKYTMNILIKEICRPHHSVMRRLLNTSPALYSKRWRVKQGLSANRNAEGVLTDAPDYSYLDGRPTPLLHKQKKRMLLQQDYATKIVTLCSELDFAKQRYQDMLHSKEEEKQHIIKNRLKPKGKALRK